jgi:regulator of nucleoside diphosphate kinase
MKTYSNFQNNDANPVVISETDFNILNKLAGQDRPAESKFSLIHELNRAIVVRQDAFPAHAIGMNSKVSIVDLETSMQRTFRVVVPSRADIKKGMVSVMSPVGTAVIGFREGEYVMWEMPGGLKKFQILKVINDLKEL